jgi:hypothetical protein
VARLAAFLDQVPAVRLALTPVVSSQDRAALEEKASDPADGKVREKKKIGDLADLAARRLEAVREGIKKSGVDGGRLRVAAVSATESAEGQVKLDLVEPEDPGPPGRPGLLRRLLSRAEPGDRPGLN